MPTSVPAPTPVPVEAAPDVAPTAPDAPPAPEPSEASEAAAALARRRHAVARERADDAPVRMADLHDLERAVEEQLTELRRPAPAATPAGGPVVVAPPAAAPAPRRGGVVPRVIGALLLVALAVAYLRGTRGGTR